MIDARRPRMGLIGDLSRAVAVLVVATSCQQTLDMSVAPIAGLSQAARLGVPIKGVPALGCWLGRALILDKTSTLTNGRPRVVSVEAMEGFGEDEMT